MPTLLLFFKISVCKNSYSFIFLKKTVNNLGLLSVAVVVCY